MTDLHTHILFDIDDGAKTLDISLEMLKKEIADGVDTVVLTPHFDPSVQKLGEFIEKRDRNAHKLQNAVGQDVRLLTAAEVVASPFLLQTEGLEKLCIKGTRALLLELPGENVSLWLEDMIYKLRVQSYTPILAHIERYKVLSDIKTLKRLADAGAVMQMNCSTFSNAGLFSRSFIKKAAAQNLIHCLGSDCHSTDWRPPCFADGLNAATRLCSKEFAQRLVNNNDLIVKNGYLKFDGFML